MTISLRARGIAGVVLDIEGTTTPVSFVSELLFSFARRELRGTLANSQEIGDAVRLLEAERAHDDAASGDLADYVEKLMDRDSKSPGLKMLQGLIWERGYREGTLRGEVFDDVPPALNRWRDEGIELAIYSSGSVLAQRLLFGSTRFGDLTPLFSHFFDTAMGAKRSPESYPRIARAMQRRCDQLLFLSDVADELHAAGVCSMQALLCVRPGNAPQPPNDFEVIRSFAEVAS